jgi:GR25 family glycosyltransferase involved in LPS biosynthesis
MDEYDFSVIHLKRSKERSKNVSIMKKQLPELYIFEAMDGKTLSEKQKKNYQKQGVFPEDITYDYICNRPFTNQHLAIWLSHVKLWEHLLKQENPKPYHIIFEDDAILQPTFNGLLVKYTPRLRKMDFAHLYVFPIQVERFELKRKGIYRMKKWLWGLQCYMIPHHKLKFLLDQIKPLQTAIDEQITRIKMKNYFIYDDFVKHGQISSENRYVKLV